MIASDPRVAALVAAALEGAAPRAGTRAALACARLREPVRILAFGKCALEMSRGALEALEPEAALVIALPGPHEDLLERGAQVVLGSHPDPADDAPEVAARALAFAGLARGTLVVLVSGGGSAMLELPAEGISIERTASIARALMHAGAAIEELNVVRAALSQVKGGRLAAATEAEVLTLVAEDVAGRPELVASGPTIPLAYGGARDVLAARGVLIDPAVERALARPAPRLAHPPRIEVVADNAGARRAVIARAAALGMPMADLGEVLRGEARDVGASILASARARGMAVVGGGETTVTVRGRGRGGRNQELVLGAIEQVQGDLLVSVGTDGIDGDSRHAGAFLDGASIERARAMGLDGARALAENDSEAFFEALGTAIVTGPTGANAADVCIAVPQPSDG